MLLLCSNEYLQLEVPDTYNRSALLRLLVELLVVTAGLCSYSVQFFDTDKA
jgi:hypothetical protein